MRRASITQREREGKERPKGSRSHVAAQGVAKKTSGLAGGLRFCANSRLQGAVWNAEIEAVERSPYPRVHTRGPIEAKGSHEGMKGEEVYPRVHTRGPIEAKHASFELGWVNRIIRGFTPAAPLKRFALAPFTASVKFYPRVHTRGPIEATSLNGEPARA